MPRTRSRELHCSAAGCDAVIRVEVTAPRRQVGRMLHDQLWERVRAEGWSCLKVAHCRRHAPEIERSATMKQRQ